MGKPWIERNDHPLLNHLVLSTVFKCVHGLDLKSCRLVCKTWNITTLPYTRSRLRVSICGTCSENVPKHKTYADFVKLMRKNTLGIPFEKFRLRPFDTAEGFGKEFIQLCGNTAIEYILDGNCDYKVEDISALLRASPKLESLKLPDKMSSKDVNGQNKTVKLFQNTNPKFSSLKSLEFEWEWSIRRKIICPTIYEELIGAAKNISTFDMKGLMVDGSRVANILTILGKFGREKTIKNLILPVMNQEILKVLRNMVSKGLVLKHLAFKVKRSEREREHCNFDWVEFLQLFKDNLISLDIYVWSSYTMRKPITLPIMPKLKILKLEINAMLMPIIFPIMPNLEILKLEIYGQTRLSCESFNQIFPILQKFICISENMNMFHNFVTGRGPQDSSTLKSLHLGNHQTVKVNIEVLNQILTVFPCLNELDCSITETDGVAVIRKIWTHMTQLQVLKLSCCTLPVLENVDSLVTGIPVKEINKFQSTDFSHGFRQMEIAARSEEIWTQIKAHRKYPSIGNMTSLRYLSLNLTSFEWRKERKNTITDFTGYFGFYSLKNLRHLHLSHCDVSRHCAEILVNDKGLVSWIFRSWSNDIGNGNVIPPRWDWSGESLL